MNKNKKKTAKRKGIKLYSALVALVVIVGLLGYIGYRHFNDDSKVASNKPQTTKGTINYSPPTAQEKAQNDQVKDNIVQEQNNATNNSGSSTNSTTKVTPFITSANKSTVDAYVPGVFENSGTCTATVTQGSQTITESSAGFENASYTQCTPISLSKDNLGSGTWTVVVSYSSSDATGQSQSMTFTNP